jgi:hypothetical protein
MTSSNVVRRLLLPVLAFAAVWSNLTPARAADCEEISAYQQAVGPGAPSGPGLSVGVAIHIMETPGHPCEVRKVWTPEQVAIIFGADTQDEQSVNSIWGPTKVRFVVLEVDLNKNDPPEDLMDPQQRVTVPMPGPRGTEKYEKAFGVLVAGNHRDHKVNVYLWRRIAGSPVGFGRSTRSGNGKATVFLDNECSQKSLKVCATYAAHELGHTLGLYHAGRSTCSAVDSQFRDLCTSLAKPCPGVKLSSRLMTPAALGRKLCPLEVKQAELMATNEFQ